MKVKLTKFLIFVILVNMLLPVFARAEEVSMSIYFDGQVANQSYPMQVNNSKYFYYGNDLTNNDFSYTQGNGEIIINRYCTELKITYGSDTILINGKSQLFTNPVFNYNDRNYISLELIASVYGSNMAVDEASRRIDVTLNQNPVLPLEKNLSGKITLPNNEVAPSSGMVFKVVVNTVSGDVYNSYYTGQNFKYVVLNGGQNSCDYSMKINDGLVNAMYAVNYELLESDYFPNYANYGYYTYYGTKSYEGKQNIIIGSSAQVDLDVVAKVKIKGIFNRKGYLGSANIYAYNEQGNYCGNHYYYGYRDSAPDFEMFVPVDAGKISLEYNMSNRVGFMNRGFYAKNGSVPFSDMKGYIDLNNDDLNIINFDVIESRTIKGTVTYSDNLIGIEDYINITANINGRSEIYGNAYKNANSNKVDYYINVPLYMDNTYTLTLRTNSDSGYISSNGAITKDEAQAKRIDVTDGNIEGVNVNITQLKVSGTITLPNNMTAANDINVRVFSENQSSDLTIPAGSSSCEYSLFAPANGSIKIGYEIFDHQEFLNGYYSVKGTVSDYYYADFIDVTSQDISGLNMQMKLAPSISGIIKLPDGVSAPVGGLGVTISVPWNGTSNVNIPQGETQVPYKIYVQEESTAMVSVRYCFNQVVDGLWDYGYYSPTGTTLRNLPNISMGNGSANNIDITLMKKIKLTGEVKLPNNKTAVNDVRGDVYAYANYNTVIFNSIESMTDNTSGEVKVSSGASSGGSSSGGGSSVTIPVDTVLVSAGQNSGTYVTYFPDDALMSGYRLNYELKGDCEYYYNGYFTENGTTSFPEYAKILPKTANNMSFALLDQHIISGVISKPESFNASFNVDISAIPFGINGSVNSTQLKFSETQTSLPYSIKVPVDVPQYVVRCSLSDSYSNFMITGVGYYKGGSAVRDSWQADLFSLSKDIENINFVLQTVQSISGQEIQIGDMLDVYGSKYDVRYSIYNNQFSLQMNNASGSVVNGKVYVSLMDENNKIINVTTADVNMQPWSSETKNMQFKNQPLLSTRKVKIVVWNSSLKPFSLPFERTFAN